MIRRKHTGLWIQYVFKEGGFLSKQSINHTYVYVEWIAIQRIIQKRKEFRRYDLGTCLLSGTDS